MRSPFFIKEKMPYVGRGGGGWTFELRRAADLS